MLEENTNKVNELNSLTCELSGVNLIEAGAGTGKTYNIQNIYAREIIESGVDITKIVALTFTNAAAGELAERIRRFLRELGEVCEMTESELNNDEEKLRHARDLYLKSIENLTEQGDSDAAQTIRGRLKNALTDFDRANIGTIHSFCQKITRELAFEGDNLFATDLVFDFGTLYKTLAADEIRRISNSSNAKLKLEILGIDKNRLSTIFDKIHQHHRKLKIVSGNISNLTDNEKNELANDLEDSTKSMEEIETQKEKYQFLLVNQCLENMEKAYQKHCQRMNVMSGDDLIHGISEKVRNDNEFVAKLRSKFKVGIIDEFQDTDPDQYEIFWRTFGNKGGTLFMVGDPRQAIYAFRGGDLHTYLKATEKAKKIYTLTKNYRSAESLIKKTNAMFQDSDKEKFFINEKLSMPEIAAGKEGFKALMVKGKEYPVLMASNLDAKSAIERVAQDILNEIGNENIWLVDKNRHPKPGDFAVITRSWDTSMEIMEILKTKNVPCAFIKGGNIFKTSTASALGDCLKAIANPDDQEGCLAAISGSLINNCYAIFNFLNISTGDNKKNDANYKECYKIFKDLNKLWAEKSFDVMFAKFQQEFHVAENLAKSEEGGIAIQDLLQLGDWLSEQAKMQGATPETLLRVYLETLTAPPEQEGDDERFARMGDDNANAVKFTTIHGSKGLEFNIVKLYGIHAGIRVDKNKVNIYHDNNDLCYDLAQRDDKEFRKEEKEERMRLAYVGVTRAVYQVTIYGNAGKKGLPKDAPFSKMYNTPGRYSDKEKDEGPYKEWHEAIGWDVDVLKTFQSSNENQPELSVSGVEEYQLTWDITSYSGLKALLDGGAVSQKSTIATEDDDKADDTEINENATTSTNVLDQLGGKLFGTAVHSLMETLDFSMFKNNQNNNNNEELLNKCKELVGLQTQNEKSDKAAEKLAEVISNVLNHRLSCGGKKFSLNEIEPNDRQSELKFYAKIRGGNGKLRKIIEAVGGEYGTEATDFSSNPRGEIRDGLITGSIDLFFRHGGKYFIADWKTDRLASYAPEDIKQTMWSSKYVLQAVIYTVALVRYLRQRLGDKFDYERDFGGVYYFFMRGINDDNDNGIWFNMPSWEMVEAMEEILNK